MIKSNKKLAIDFDGTIVEDAYPGIGKAKTFAFETLKKLKLNLAIHSGVETFDEELNLMLKLSLSFMDNWLQQSSELVLVTIQNPTLSQEEIGLKLGINQAAVSRRRKRANYELVKEFDLYFRKKIKILEV